MQLTRTLKLFEIPDQDAAMIQHKQICLKLGYRFRLNQNRRSV